METLYAEAARSEEKGMACCVDQYFELAAQTASLFNPFQPAGRSYELHRTALIKIVECGTRFSRLDPRHGLVVVRHNKQVLIPIHHHGFVWETEDFERLTPVPNYTSRSLRNIYREPGLGVPLLVTSNRPRQNPFLNKNVVFPATLVFRVDETDGEESSSGEQTEVDRYALELYDPYRFDLADIGGPPTRLAKDLSSPFAYRLRDYKGNFITEFLTPGATEGESRLYTIEPYQQGKIPIVLVHGLLSDRFTWLEMINELYATKGFHEHFQIWNFEYPTGQPFFTSATVLRIKLEEARRAFDPNGCDAKLSEMILVGHSMGGLIAKMQVTYSGDDLWGSVARVPIEWLTISPSMKEKLVSAFFFDPSPHISRLVFIGTPHRGSTYARRPIGRLASSLVSPPEERQRSHRELIDRNPGAFRSEVSQRIPSSIDMLEPSSELLQTIDKLPIAPNVKLHSIIGNSRWTLGNGPSDGIVPVESARHAKAISERKIFETHSKLHKHQDAVCELIAILNQHVSER